MSLTTAALRQPKRVSRLKRAAFEFFNAGAGSPLAALAIDVHFRLWKFKYHGAAFSDYYAGSIADELRRGKAHKTLGGKQFLSGSLLSAPLDVDLGAHRSRGVEYFGIAVKSGLLPLHRCIDYGCGSLRVGQHLIAHLGPQRYLGLDIVSDFYEAGKPLLAPGTLESKRPGFMVIGPRALAAGKSFAPDFIFSFAVMKHVPPAELAAYFSSIAGMMPAGGRAVITFNRAERSVRSGAKIWDYCEGDIATALRAADPSLAFAISPLAAVDGRTLPRSSVLTISRGFGPRSAQFPRSLEMRDDEVG